MTIGFALSAMQFPLFWGLLMLAMTSAENEKSAWIVYGAIWLSRAGLGALRDRLLRRRSTLPIWSLPMRDLLSIMIILTSYRSNRVAWRGQQHQVLAFTRAELEPGRG